MRITIVSTLSVALLAAAAYSQVAPGQAIHGAILSSPTPLILVDRSPSVTVVTGLTVSNDIGAVKLDPVDSSIWLGESGSANIARITLNGSAVSTQTRFANHGGAGGTAAIALDGDCNILAAGGTPTMGGGVWRIDRNSAAVAQIIGPTSGLTDIVNAMACDRFTGDIYVGFFGSGAIYKMSPPSYTPSLFATVPNTNVSGLALARRSTTLLFVSMYGGASNSSLAAVDVFGTATPVPGTPPWADLNWVTYDRQRDDLWVIGTVSAKSIWSSTVSGANTLLHTLPGPGLLGVPSALDVNDFVEGSLVVCPTLVPSPPAPITIEHGLSGKPGHIGVIAMLQPFFLVLAAGTFDAAGRLAAKIPDVGIPPGNPGRFQFLAAAIDPSTLTALLSNQVAWPAN